MGVNWKFSDGGQAIGNQQLVPEMTVGQSPSGSDLNFGFKYGPWPLLGDLAASLSLAEIDNTIKIISSPRIMTLTGSPATVNVTDVLQFLSSSQSALTANAPVVNSYKDVSIPTILNVTPNVTPDNFVMMKVNVSRAVASVNAGGGSSQSTRTVETNILIRDGQTATIGGLYQTDALDSVNGVPVLKDIPFLGALFRSKQESKTKTELLIFLTPRVITQDLPATQAKEGVSL
jgi:type IV pilus assembly protein PilQ